MFNSFRWSLDNRIQVQTSYSGGTVRRVDRPESSALSDRNQLFIFDPRTEAFETASAGGQHGMSMDDWGRTFVNTNSEPIFQIMYDGRYLARNPYLQARPAMYRIAAGGFDRVAAIEILGFAEFAEVADLASRLLKSRQPQAVQAAVLKTLSGFESPAVPELLVQAWLGLSPPLRANALELLRWRATRAAARRFCSSNLPPFTGLTKSARKLAPI